MASSKAISIPVTGNAAPLRSELNKAQKQLDRFAQQTAAKARSAGKAFGAAAIGAGYLASRMNAAYEAASTANARITQIATSMNLFGSATGVVSKRLQDLARATALQTGVDANQIKLTEAKLLTFRKLAYTAGEVGGAFDRATKAAIDMAAAGFGEAEQNATQLGKALEDPIKGITALRRSGITFTNEEREQIRVLVEGNNVREAQNLILKAIETQVGGTAVATANASDKMREGFRVVKEEVGKGLAPAFEALSTYAISFGEWAQNNSALVGALGIALITIPPAIMAVRAAMAVSTAVSAAYAAAQAAVAAGTLAVQASTVVGIATATAAAATIAIVTKKVYDSVKAKAADKAATDALSASNATLITTQAQLNAYMGPVPSRNLAQFQKHYEGFTVAADAAATAAKDLAAANRQRLSSALDHAKQKLKELTQASDSYRDSIRDTVTGYISLADAISGSTDREGVYTQALEERRLAYEELAKLQAVVFDAATGRTTVADAEDLAAAMERVAKAEGAVATAQGQRKSYSQLFKEQITAAKSFGESLKTLVEQGLEPAGLQQLLNLGPVAGAQVAKDILAGTAGLTVGGLNADFRAVADAGLALGGASAAQQYGAAIAGAQGAVAATTTAQTMNVTINATSADPDKVVAAIVEWSKRNGKLPQVIKVS